MSKRNTFFWFMGILALGILMSAGIISTKTPGAKKQKSLSLPVVDVMPITPQPYTQMVYSQGRITSRESTRLSSEVNGAVVWIADTFQEGKTLKKGSAIAKIDDAPYRSQLSQAKANLAQAELSLAEERARAQQAAEDWAALKDSSSQPDTHADLTDQSQATNPLVTRQPQLQLAEAQLRAAQAAVRQARDDVDSTNVRLPFDAIIDQRHIATGQYLALGAPIADLLGQQREVRLPLSARQAEVLNQAKASRVWLRESNTHDSSPGYSSDPSSPSTTWPATLSHIDANVDPNTQVIYATASLAPDSTAPIGLFVSAEVEAQKLDQALLLPVSALHRDAQQQPYVFTVVTEDSTQRLKRLPVTLGFKDKEHWVIDLKVHPNLITHSHLVVTRLNLMTEGMAVELANESQVDTTSESNRND